MNLLDQARRLFQGVAPGVSARPQPFRVTCSEGHPISGQRHEGYQALRCPTCGDGVFVLPRSPLPDPPRPAEKRAAVKRRDPDRSDFADDDPLELTDPVARWQDTGTPDDIEIDWESEAEAAPSAPPEEARSASRQPSAEPAKDDSQERPGEPERVEPPQAPARARRPSRPEGGERRRPVATGPAPEEEEKRIPTADLLREWGRRHRNLLIFGGVLFVVVTTALYRLGQSKKEDLPLVAEQGRTEGIRALDRGSFDKAHQLLSRAKAAVNTLGGAIEGADEIRQAADEAAIFANLVPDSLEAILAEAARSDPTAWPERFRGLYRGRTVIIDANVTAVPTDSGASGYEIDYRVFQGGKGTRPSSVGRIDTAGLQLFDATHPKVGDRVRFGARLESLNYDAGREVWLFGLDPSSGVSMTHEGALEAFGWPRDQAAVPEESP